MRIFEDRRPALVLLWAGLMWGCAKESVPELPQSPRVEVKIALVRKGPVDDVVMATGSTVVRREAQLRSPITGVIVGFSFFDGDKIHKGQIVASLRPKEAMAGLQGAEQLLANAKTDRQRDEAKKAIELAQSSSSAISLHAPFDGILTEKAKNEMELVSEGEAIASLIDPSSMTFVADIPSSSISRIRQGESVNVRFSARPGKVYRGSVHRVEQQVNSADQTVRVHIEFGDRNLDLAGSLFGEASFVVGRRENVLLVPRSALLRDDERNVSSVVVVTDSLAHRVDVSVGAVGDSVAEISAPEITAGSVVVTTGHYGLPDSTLVRIVQ